MEVATILAQLHLDTASIVAGLIHGVVEDTPITISDIDCAGAGVNGRTGPLSRELKNGDTVEIMTSPQQWPSQDWLAFVKTSRARSKIRQWIGKQEFDAAVQIGKDFLEPQLEKMRKSLPSDEETLQKTVESVDYQKSDEVTDYSVSQEGRATVDPFWGRGKGSVGGGGVLPGDRSLPAERHR